CEVKKPANKEITLGNNKLQEILNRSKPDYFKEIMCNDEKDKSIDNVYIDRKESIKSKMIEDRQKKMEKLGNIYGDNYDDSEKTQKSFKIIEKAKLTKVLEQEEIKKFKKDLDQAQCYAMRDIQVEEKQKKRAEEAKYEKYLDLELRKKFEEQVLEDVKCQ
ncbi:MAG: hypothetical protein MHPSP_004205, partial [Paramarteilia canceri]